MKVKVLVVLAVLAWSLFGVGVAMTMISLDEALRKPKVGTCP
ncbi:hypothetical protein X566_01515 [Afipia sp. P52-10]|nr:hypothetical protein [Afipia sp. P52-10]ETR79327.1 hypothetical protein X566_01515 [Afipia sp. P52-10]